MSCMRQVIVRESAGFVRTRSYASSFSQTHAQAFALFLFGRMVIAHTTRTQRTFENDAHISRRTVSPHASVPQA